MLNYISKRVEENFPENKNYSAAEYAARSVVGAGITLTGAVSCIVACKQKEIFRMRTSSEQPSSVGAFYKVDALGKAELIGIESVFAIGGPIVLVYGLMVTKRALKSFGKKLFA